VTQFTLTIAASLPSYLSHKNSNKHANGRTAFTSVACGSP
jgi:hypothetical protein